jgi:hypothetical protein
MCPSLCHFSPNLHVSSESPSTAPKVIWFLSIFELLLDEGEKVVEFMTPTPKVPMVGADEGGTRQCPRFRTFWIRGRGHRMNTKVWIQTKKAKLDVY